LKLTTDGHKASHGLSATEILVHVCLLACGLKPVEVYGGVVVLQIGWPA